VLLSRTHYANDIIFVGPPGDTVNALASVLQQRSQFSEYISHLLCRLSTDANPDGTDAPIEVSFENHPYRPVDVEIPYDNSGYSYLLVSLRHPSVTYIGQTNNIRRRLREHNSGYGARQTSDERLRPWALLTFVCGFEGDRRAQVEFEKRWQVMRSLEQARVGSALTPTMIGQLAGTVALQLNRRRSHHPLDLRVVHSGTFGT